MEPLEQIAALVKERDEMPQRLADAIDQARATGATWEQIGQALGTTHSGAIKAHQRLKETNR